MNPFARALSDFHTGDPDAAFTLCRDDGFRQRIPAGLFFDQGHYPGLETRAMDLCRGDILDIGCAAGRHSLELRRRGFSVTSLDILPEMESILRDRGLSDVVIADICHYSARRYDSLLMLMNGIGMVGDTGGLTRFLRHAHDLVASGGQIVCDSIDVRRTSHPVHVAYRERNLASHRPAGQQAFTMSHEGEEPVRFGWLHIDFPTLSRIAASTGWDAELVESEDDGHYLCRLM